MALDLFVPNGTAPSVAAILDPEGRTVIRVPAEAGKLLLQVDMFLRDLGLQFTLKCLECHTAAHPNLEGTDVVWKCAHARRVSSQL